MSIHLWFYSPISVVAFYEGWNFVKTADGFPIEECGMFLMGREK